MPYPRWPTGSCGSRTAPYAPWGRRICSPTWQPATRGWARASPPSGGPAACRGRADVSVGPRALGVGEREVERRTDDALEDLDLTPHAAHHPYGLPPALRKLAALAGVLALEPALLVLDEPTIGLDRALRARVTRGLLERSAAGAALLVITHDLTFAAETLERGLVLDRGTLACDEPLAALLGDAKRLEPLGLEPPPVAALSAALDLPGRPVRAAEAARELARVARGRPAP